MKSCLVAHKDVRVNKIIAGILKNDFKVSDVRSVVDGDAAWSALKDGGIDGVVIDLDIEKMPSALLFNRLRQDSRTRYLPVMFIAKGNPKERVGLFKDNPPTGVLDGVFSSQAFTMKFDTLMKESGRFLSDDAIAKRVASTAGRIGDDILVEINAMVKASPNPITTLNIAVRRLCEVGKYSEAEVFLKQATKINSQNATTVFVNANLCRLTGKYREGLAILASHKHSLKDLGRVTLLAELNLLSLNLDESQRIFQMAAEIDPLSDRVKCGLTLIELLKDFIGKKNEVKLSDSLMSCVMIVNAHWVKEKETDRAILLLNSMIEFAAEVVDQAKLMYEIAMILLPTQKADALAWLSKAALLAQEKWPMPAAKIAELKRKAA